MAVIAPIVTGLLTDPNKTTPPNPAAAAPPPAPKPPTAAQSLTSSIGASSQDLAKQQGVAYEGLAKTAEGTTADFADYDSAGAVTEAAGVFQPAKATSYYDKALGTIAGQMESLYSADNPYIKNARTGAKEMAASRGALNTSMAAGQAERGAIEAGFKIAEGDANAYNKFALNQQASENQLGQIQVEGVVSGKLNQQTASIALTQKNIDNAFNARLSAVDATTKTKLEGLKAGWEVGLQDMTNTFNAVIQQQDISSRRSESLQTNLNSIMQSSSITMETWMTDKDFLDLDEKSQLDAINALKVRTRNQMNFSGAAAGIDVSSFVSRYML